MLRQRIPQPIILSMLVVLCMGFLAVLIWQGIIILPVIKDSTGPLYLGQHLLRGNAPYTDVYYFHPPLRFVEGAIYVLAADLLGVSVVTTARLINLALLSGLLIMTYAIAYTWSGGSTLTGLMAVIILFSFQLFAPVSLPNTKVSVSFTLLMSVWLVQQQRWWWAGIVIAVAGLLWLPAGALALVAFVTALLSGRWLLSLAKVAAGGGLVCGLVGGWLLLNGSLMAFVRQVVLAALGYSGTVTIEGPQAAQTTTGFTQQMLGVFEGLELIGVLILLGLIVSLWRYLHHSDPARLGPLLGLLIIMALFRIDFQGRGDLIVALGLLAAVGAMAFTPFFRRTQSPWVVASLFAAIILYSAYGWQPVRHTAASIQGPTQYSQEGMAAQLAPLLGPEDSVLSMQNLWLNIFLDQPAPIPVIQLGPKAQASLSTEDISLSEVATLIDDTPPTVILIDRSWYRQLRNAGMQTGYQQVGVVAIVGEATPQYVYVRPDRQDIITLIQTSWDLQE